MAATQRGINYSIMVSFSQTADDNNQQAVKVYQNKTNSLQVELIQSFSSLKFLSVFT